jgi:hypothetical protein
MLCLGPSKPWRLSSAIQIAREPLVTIHRTELARATLHAARVASRWDLLALPIEPCSRGMAPGDTHLPRRSNVSQVRASKCPDLFSEGHTGCRREWRRGSLGVPSSPGRVRDTAGPPQGRSRLMLMGALGGGAGACEGAEPHVTARGG